MKNQDDPKLKFRKRDFKGSRLRCLLLTSNPREKVAKFFNSLSDGFAQVSPSDYWAPNGLIDPDEAKLGKTPGFLSETARKELTNWWLVKKAHANTPNWDLVSTCQISGKPGLIIVEAKGHDSEFANDRCGASHEGNSLRIKKALAEANLGWDPLYPGISLSAESHYQLSNRFAFAWKIATMGIPVVLVYLGFLQAEEMGDTFKNHLDWHNCLLKRSRGTIPKGVWNKSYDVKGIPLIVLSKSAYVKLDVQVSNPEV